MNISQKIILSLLLLFTVLLPCGARERLNFNADWQLHIGDDIDYSIEQGMTGIDHGYGRVAADNTLSWKNVTLPYAFNGDEAFRKDIIDHTDTICWYRKTFNLRDMRDKRVFLEIEGVRQCGMVFVNGRFAGMTENGVMASGYDLTPYIKEGENVLMVRTDNSWKYRSEAYGSRYQWNDRNFNANYGGMVKNVYLHITSDVYQTLPLYSNLGTTGVYVYATDFDIVGRKALIHTESEVKNDSRKPVTLCLATNVYDVEGKKVATFSGASQTITAGGKAILKAQDEVEDLHFWSWGYGYLYTVKTSLTDSKGNVIDEVCTTTGFRKTEFRNGITWLNDRALMMHGYAQRTSNEWPGVGLSVPAWLSDYSNGLMVESGGNLVRWMHVTPWKQDVESCDRVGLLQAMPAGDAEKDVEGPRWLMRKDLMRDAIIYMRNSPSIVFYECGNHGISEEHMREMLAIRNEYDPHGGRAIGSREMLDSKSAEYGGEMLYINKSATKPVWAMEYCRDEGLRKYWDEYSYPYHKEGEGPLCKGKPAKDYNHNQDQLTIEQIRRWYDYWLERPGTGSRVSNGGVKIIFSDTNTHHRGEVNYRTSGVVDAMRIPKDAFFANQVMWTGWVEDETPRTYIIGHWNYDAGVVKPIHVVSNADSVALFVNGRYVGSGRQQYNYLHTIDSVAFEPGTLTAVSYEGQREVSRYSIATAGAPDHLRLSIIQNPQGFQADGADMVLIEVEAVDAEGRRCPLYDGKVSFTLMGEAEWIGGIALKNDTLLAAPQLPADPTAKKGEGEDVLASSDTRNLSDNYVGATTLPLECGVNRILLRSTTKSGQIRLTATAEGLPEAAVALSSVKPVGVGCMTAPFKPLRGETPTSPSYSDTFHSVDIASVRAGSNDSIAVSSIDDNERTEWKSDGRYGNSWIAYTFREQTVVDEVVLKLAGWRSKCYPLAVYADEEKVWEGITPASLGYVHLPIAKPVSCRTLTIRMTAPAIDSSKFGEIRELAGGVANSMEIVANRGGKTNLRIIETDILRRVNH